MMGVGVSVLAGIFFGLVAGVMGAVVLVFLKSWWERRKAIKKQGKQNIIDSIKSQQEEQNANRKEERRKRNAARSPAGTTTRIPGTTDSQIRDREFKRQDTNPTDKTDNSKRFGISLSTSSFIIRD